MMFRNWPAGLVISFLCLSLLLGGLFFWMFSIQTAYQQREQETVQARREGLQTSGRNMIRQQEALLKEQAMAALVTGDPHKSLLGWANPNSRELVVFPPPPDFRISQERAIGNVDRWRGALNSDKVQPSGLPRRLIATVELAGSGVSLSAEEERLWQANMRALWNNGDQLNLLKLHTLINALPDETKAPFFIHISLIRKVLNLSETEGVFVSYGDRTGMMRFSTRQWETARDGFEKMGLHLDDNTFVKVPGLALLPQDTELARKHRRERLFLMVGGFLLLLILGVTLMTTRTLINTHRSRQMLLHAVSHEFRTPLSAILQFSEMLMDKRYANQEKADAYLGQIHQEGLRLQGLLENVLTMARIEKRLFVVQPEPRDVKRFLADLESQLAMMGGGNHQLAFTADHEPFQAMFDEDALIKVIRNLLDNAVKYGAPPFSLTSRREGSLWLLEIADEGPGLAPEVRRKLFQPYTRKTRDASEGVGLGLHLVKTIVDAHHGAIQFQNGASQGLRVSISLPLAVSDPSQTLKEER